MVKVCIIALAMLVACTAASPFGGLLPAGKDFLGNTGNLIGIEADIHGKVAGQEIGAEAGAGIGEHGIEGHGAGAADIFGQRAGAETGAGIGEHGIGGHGAGAADIFGQQAGTHADVLDGYPEEHHGRHDHRQHSFEPNQRRGYGHGY